MNIYKFYVLGWTRFLMFGKFAQLNVVKSHAIGTSKCAYYITRG